MLEKTLESPLDSKESKQVSPKGINPEYSLEGLMLKPRLQYFDYLMVEFAYWEIPYAKIESKRRRG